MNKQKSCEVCGSKSIQVINTYKHFAYICNDCHSVSHSKNKSKYFLEYILPSKLFKKIIPSKAYARLFHVDNDFMNRKDFFSVYKNHCLNDTPERISQLRELFDQLELAKIDYSSSDFLDISGGPGILCRKLKEHVKSVEFTELEKSVVEAISEAADIKGYQFDYYEDNIEDVIKDKKYDIILIRSSIIFCPNLEKLINSLKNLLNKNGYILIETIIPTMGEILWWQQLEYKFPRIYSQQYIENVFRLNKFDLKISYRNYGSYITNKLRARKRGFDKFLFTWLIEYPMVLMYQLKNIFVNTPIEKSMNHKMLTQIWQLTNANTSDIKLLKTIDIKDSEEFSSSHFTRIYNGYLKKLK